MKTGTIFALGGVLVATMTCAACGSKQTSASTPNATASGESPAASASASAPAASASAAPPAEKPFAKTPLEAQSLIQGQIDSHIDPLWKCVTDFRTKVNDKHRPVVADIGIDQEGHLIGITSATPKKGDLDPTMRECMMSVLRGLPFPRSHAGIITVRQNFSDVSVQP